MAIISKDEARLAASIMKIPSYGKSPQVHFKAVGKMNDPTGNRAVTNIIRRHKAEKKAKSRRRRQGDQIQRAARRCSL